MSALVECADHPIWVGWHYEERDGKKNKVPINPATGRRAKSSDSGTWRCRAAAEACAQARGLDGIGINLADIGNGFALAGIDLDTCRSTVDGNVAPWAREVIDRIGSYTEVSPSETGFKIFLKMPAEDRDALLADLRVASGDEETAGRKWVVGSVGGEHPPAIELYLGRRYFTVTGRRLDGTPDALHVVDIDTLRWLIREKGPALAGDGSQGWGASAKTNDNSRSGVAYRQALALRRVGKIKTYDEMRAALRADPETADWVSEKGEPHGGRELRRIWEKIERIIAATPPYQIDPKAPLAAARLFRELRYDAEDRPTLHYHRGGFFAWSGVAYPETDIAEVRAQVYTFLDDCVMRVKDKEGEDWRQASVKPNTNLVNNVMDALRAAALLPASASAPSWLDQRSDPDASEIIACANGLSHLPTMRLMPHTPAYFTHNAVDFAFDPDAHRPEAWLRFLDELWNDDAESVATLQDIFGYALGADTSQQKAFLLVGPKRSGKGTIARVLTRLVGKENSVSPTLASLGANFGLAPLIGKRMAIISDARLSGRSDQAVIAERILSITGEDGITIDRKYRDAWTGQLQTRFLILSNELPRLNDASGALASRFIVLVLKESFFGREDPGLTGQLLGELPGILNWAIEGWRRVRERGYFVQPASALEVVEELEDLGSPIGAFLRDRCVIEAGGAIEVGELFATWEDWCLAQRRDRPGDRQTFGRNLRAAAPRIAIKQRRLREGGAERYYDGIRLKTPAELAGMTTEETAEVEIRLRMMIEPSDPA